MYYFLIQFEVLRTKDNKIIPFWSTIGTLLMGLCWTSYGFKNFDLAIIIPNCLGVLFALVNIMLY